MDELGRRLAESRAYLEKRIYTEERAKVKQAKPEFAPEFAVIFGTGLADETLKETLKNSGEYTEISYKDIPHFRTTGVKSHSGRMVVARINGSDVILMAGRAHYYEGHNIQEVVYPVHLLREMGVKQILITSSVGGVNKELKEGDLMLVKDHINLTSLNPLIGYDNSLGERFLRCSNLYNNKLREKIKEICLREDIRLREGTMFFLPGPSFETKAEFNSAGILGGDTIGWSTVPEAVVAHYRGMSVAAINCITDSLNWESCLSEDSRLAEDSPPEKNSLPSLSENSLGNPLLDRIIKVGNESGKKLYRIVYSLAGKVR